MFTLNFGTEHKLQRYFAKEERKSNFSFFVSKEIKVFLGLYLETVKIILTFRTLLRIGTIKGFHLTYYLKMKTSLNTEA